MAKQAKVDERPLRELYQVWIDGAKPNTSQMIKQFNYWRKHRKLTSWITDMFELWHELSAGRTDKLIALFPQFASKLIALDNDPMLEAIYNQQVEILQKLNSGASVAAQPASIGKTLNIGNIKAPTYDDDDTVVMKVDTDAGAVGSSNFMSSAFGLAD